MRKQTDKFRSLLIRESIVALTIRIFFVELLLGLFGLSVRIPILYLLGMLNLNVSAYLTYAIIYLIFQTINVFLLIALILEWHNKEYVLREKDISIKRGIFTLNENFLQYDNMEKVTVNQTFIGKLFGFGSIEIFNPLLRENTYLSNVPNPRKYAKIIQNIVPKVTQDKQKVLISR